jgi:hypothetical protein
MMSHDQAFALAKMRQVELEADAAATRLVRAPEEPVAEVEAKAGGGLLASGRRRWRLFGRVRPA